MSGVQVYITDTVKDTAHTHDVSTQISIAAPPRSMYARAPTRLYAAEQITADHTHLTHIPTSPSPAPVQPYVHHPSSERKAPAPSSVSSSTATDSSPIIITAHARPPCTLRPRSSETQRATGGVARERLRACAAYARYALADVQARAARMHGWRLARLLWTMRRSTSPKTEDRLETVVALIVALR